MSKRKPALASKHAARPKMAAKAQRAAQAIVRSPKDNRLRFVAVDSPEPSSERHNDSKQEAPLGVNPATDPQTQALPEHHADSREALLVSKQEAPLVESPATAPQDDRKQVTSDSGSKKGFVFSSAPANVRTYQAKLQEMAQADMQFAFEFSERLAAIRSPVEFPRVVAEFTGKRIAMFMELFKRTTR